MVNLLIVLLFSLNMINLLTVLLFSPLLKEGKAFQALVGWLVGLVGLLVWLGFQQFKAINTDLFIYLKKSSKN